MSQDTCPICDLLITGCATISQDDYFYTLASRLLCEIAVNTAASGGGNTPVEATFLPMASIAAGSVTNAYQALLTDAHNKKYVNVYNRTDQAILVSFDGTHDYTVVGSYSSFTIPFAQSNNFFNGNVYIKYLDTQPSQNSVYASAYY